MKKVIKTLWPFLLCSILVLIFWKTSTQTDSYALHPQGKEVLILDLALESIFVYKGLFWLVVVNLIVSAIVQIIRDNRKTCALISVIVVSFYAMATPVVNKACAFEYYKVFLHQSVTEKNIVTPIIEAGSSIGQYLNDYISDTASKYRRYAIDGLGQIKYEPSVPVLKQILFNESEKDYIREDAYAALQKIDSRESTAVILQYNQIFGKL
jgi:hypothetical protein